MFASLNAFIIPVVYFFFPETAGRSLEGTLAPRVNDWTHLLMGYLDMDVIFALAYNENVSPVAVSLRKDVPPAGTPEADEILGVRSRRSSTSREEINIQNKE